MKLASTLFIVLALATAPVLLAQTTVPITPPSLALTGLGSATTVTLPALNHAQFFAEDEAEFEAAKLTGEFPPYRTAAPLDVSFNFSAGSWENLPNGDRIWRLRIVSPGATDLYLQYDAWRLVKPCELYLYNDDLSSVLGPFTYIDNWDGTNVTPLTKGEAVTLEYLVPAGVEDYGELSILRVGHGYRNFLSRLGRENEDALDNYGDAMACHWNVRCFPDWQDEKRSVALILNAASARWCTGTMLNNVPQNGDPLFLTANHCLDGMQSNWMFVFNYESPQCSPSSDGNPNQVLSNATLLASYDSTDFALLRLARTRPNSAFVPRYEGWDRLDIAPERSYSIHHPAGDVMKISYDSDPATSDTWNGAGLNTHWGLNWNIGTAQPGSSGSGLWDEFSRVVGQCHGGVTDCNFTNGEYTSYGKLARSWEGGGTPGTRLRDWLDPNNTGANFTNPYQPVAPPNDICGDGVPHIMTLPFSYSGNTTYARDDATLTCSNNNTAGDVYFTMQFSCDYQVTISTCGSSFDTQLDVKRTTSWGGCQEATGFQITCNDDFCGLQSQVTFLAASAEFYTVRLDGYGAARGAYTINFTGFSTGAQDNATCPGRTITTVPWFDYSATWCGGDHVTMSCAAGDGADVVYNWLSPYNQWMRAKTCYINFDTILEVRYSGACPGSFVAGCNDDTYCGSDALASAVVFNASVGVPYYIHLDGYSAAEGIASVELEVYNDNCSSPFVIGGIPFNTFGDTRPARDDFATYIGATSKEVFYRYTATACQTVGVSTCNTDTPYDSYLEVRSGGACPGSTIVAFNDDCGGGFNGYQSQLSFSAETGRTYYIIVAGYATNEGPFALYVYPIGGTPAAPYADACPGYVIPSLPFTDYGSTNCMYNQYWNCVGYPNLSREMVYTMNLPTCQQVTVSLCGSGYDTGLGLYGGPGSGVCDLAPSLLCNDDYCGLQSQLTFTALANTNYQFLIHGFLTYSGPYVINVSGTPCILPPDTVENLVIHGADPNNGDVKLTWSPAANATSYNVYYSLISGQGADPDNLYLNTVSTTATISNVPTDIGFFVVTALNAGGAPNMIQPEPEILPKEMVVQGPIVLPGDNPFGDNSLTPAEMLVGSREYSIAK